MKDKDFQQLVDHEFSQLAWSDQQRMDTLRKMQKEERPVMKRKFSVAIIAVALLLTLTGTAVAAGLTIPTLQEFFNLRTTRAYWYDAVNDTYSFYDAPIVDETAIARPLAQRHTSQRVNITVDQLYLTDEAFYFTVLFTPKQENTLLFSGAHNSIMLDGKEQYYWNLWDRKELALYNVGSMSIDDLNGRDRPIELDYAESHRDPETGAIAFMYAFKNAEDIAMLRAWSGGTLMLRFQVQDLRGHDLEWNVLFVDFPRLQKTDAHDNYLTN